MKNADLEALLKERGLPHTGKKADMVARLQENDNSSEAAPVASTNEDEIDWDDDAAEAPIAKPAEPTPAVSATTTNVEGNNPQAVPNQIPAIDPATTNDLTVKEPNKQTAETAEEEQVEEPAAPISDYTAGLPTTDLEKEIEKRKARNIRFGIKEGEEDPEAVEAIKKLERAKKFEKNDEALSKMDVALPERREKRRRDGGDDRGGDYKRRGGRGFGGRRGGGYRGDDRRNDRGGDRRPREPRERQERTRGGWMNETDRAAAEARKARFANQGA